MLSASALGSAIDTALAGTGAKGPKRSSFSLAVATGIVNALVGKTFATTDAGSGSGGTGVGTGITGLSPSAMASTALAVMTSTGPKAAPMLDAIMTAVQSYLSTATTLTTNDPSVGAGSGVVVVGSFSVTTSDMASKIENALIADGASGSELPNISLALATGVAGQILATGTGAISISGSGGTSSSGAGTGVIS